MFVDEIADDARIYSLPFLVAIVPFSLSSSGTVIGIAIFVISEMES